MLDLFCYTGGFAISAAAQGAKACVGVDSSARAVELARRNAALNGFGSGEEAEEEQQGEQDAVRFVQADVHKYLKGAAEGGGGGGAARQPTELYDVVVCDPPKFAPSIKDMPRATRKYRQLNSGAIRALKPGGLLLSCSCSAAMTQSGSFVKVLTEAAANEGRSLTVIRTSGAAADHVINPGCPESSYLTAVLAFVH